MNAVDAGPRRDEGEDTSDEIDEGVGGVVFVAPCAPEFVEPCAADYEGGIDFETVGSESGVFKVFAELVEVAFHANIGKIGHHVADDFEAGVFGQFEGFGDSGDSVSAVGVSGNVFVKRLYADFEAGAAVAEHTA